MRQSECEGDFEMRGNNETPVNSGILAYGSEGRAETKARVVEKKIRRPFAVTGLGLFCLAPLLLCGGAAFGQATKPQPVRAAGPGQVIVHSKFGGQIFGYDIDQNGTDGLLSEDKVLANGDVLAAVETFDQTTGDITGVAAETENQDNFVTMGITGTSVGLVEQEQVQGMYVVNRIFKTLQANKPRGNWTPPIGTEHIIMPGGVSRNQGEPYNAVFAYDNSGNFIPYVFGSNVAKNAFGPVVQITDSYNFGSVPPPIAFDSKTEQAILGGGDGCFDCFPVIGLVNLAAGTFSEFGGIGFGFINGIAVDSADGIFCTTTEDDANVEFYDLATQTGFQVVLPGSEGQQYYSGADVEFDPINKLFLIAQPESSSAPSGSTIYAYSTNGTLEETLNGFSFPNAFNLIGAYIALNPSQRSGYVNGPDSGETQLQSFTY